MTVTLPDTSALAPAVASLLGPDWTAYRDEEGSSERAYFLHHRDGYRVRLSVSTWTTDRDYGRLHAAGYLPDKPADVGPDTTGIDSGNITMAGTKTARQVAADIQRRLLPTLSNALATWTDKVERLRAEEAQRWAVAERLARVAGLSQPVRAAYGIWTDRRKWHLTWDGAPRGEEGPHRYSTTPRAGVEVDATQSGEHVGIELSGLSVDQADRVLRALLEAEPPDPARGPQLTGQGDVAPQSPGSEGRANRVDRVRAAHRAVRSELIAALQSDLCQRVTGCYPGAAWLVVDPSRWLESWGDSEVELRAVIDRNGQVLHEHQPCQDGFTHLDGQRHGEWGRQIDEALTEIADLDGTSGWPQICDVILWSCELRAVPLSTDVPQELPYSHDGHDTDEA